MLSTLFLILKRMPKKRYILFALGLIVGYNAFLISRDSKLYEFYDRPTQNHLQSSQEVSN